ncbi:PrgI family protein [Desulfofundulus thermosubterraneus]|uniref:PrgI family protein n=1 Tax=Desulfofundulus thermosubterraneus DSM 16057 TaxID=1121432 RepID=A0A1M6JBX2_9FIRM|nr:PrgI family protein [Desulfofundulus thermosubterraneus]SHJ44122.1 PrgI family protein [Desulfofundulus thermosubterraneus DSM 16057]
MYYPTPVQFDKEDKIVGGRFTLRQFIYLLAGPAAAGVLSTICWLYTNRLDALTIIVMLAVFGAPGAALGILSDPDCRRFGGGPLDQYIFSILRFTFLTKTWPLR